MRKGKIGKGSAKRHSDVYTHIAVILDRTGSMESIREDTIGGFNAFLQKQQSVPGKATMTLVQFDSQDPYEIIHRFKPIEQVPELTRETYVPRAMTPLLDALGRGINDLEKSIGALKKGDRPSKIVFVVITDGQENASREFRKDQISKMIKKKTDQSGWQFVFLSADLDAIGDAMSVGICSQRFLLFEKNKKGTKDAWDSIAQQTVAVRCSQAESICFDDDDRKHPGDPFKKQ